MAKHDRNEKEHGGLPKYARDADRSRLVRLFCKGKCVDLRWAQIQQDPPPMETLRQAQAFEYSAVCLVCEGVANDPYNWLEYYEASQGREARAVDATRRREINRENAQKSTGPKTAAGKARSSRNARRHDLLSRRLLLEGESASELKQLRDGMRKSSRPVGELEEELVERMVSAVWRKRRGDRVELGLWDWRGTVSSGKSTLANVFFMDSQHDQSLQKLTRYMTAASGEFRRAYQMLQEAQAARLAQGEEDDWVDAETPEVENPEDDDDDPDGGGGGAQVSAPITEAGVTDFALGPDWVAQGEGVAPRRNVAPRDPLAHVRPEVPPRRRWEDLPAAERAIFSVRNHDHVMAFDEMLQEVLGNRQWMERLGVRDLLRVKDSFNATRWETIRGIGELLKEEDENEAKPEVGTGH